MRRLALVLLLGILLAVGCGAPERAPAAAGAAPAAESFRVPAGFPHEGLAPQTAFRERRDHAWVVGRGTVERLLRDDTKPPRHQRFVVRVAPDLTLMFAHNVDIAPRVPLKRGDTIAFRGEYVWNAQGGVVHWTHRDKRDRNGGGWIVWNGQNFR